MRTEKKLLILFLIIHCSIATTCKAQFQLSVGGGPSFSEKAMPQLTIEPNYLVKDFIFGISGGYLFSENYGFIGQVYADLFPPSRIKALDKKCLFGMGFGSFLTTRNVNLTQELLYGLTPRIGYKFSKKTRVLLSVIMTDSEEQNPTLTSVLILFDL